MGKEETFPLFLFISTSHFTKDGPDKHGFLIEKYIYFPFNHKCHFTALNHYIRDAILKHSLGNNQVSVSIENQLIIKFSTTILSTNIEPVGNTIFIEYILDFRYGITRYYIVAFINVISA